MIRMQREPTAVELKAKSQADCHARGGGYPGHVTKRVRRGVWIPAFAGMTLVVVLAAISSGASAHTGVDHEYSFFAGLRHPFTGADHTLAMVAVGLWAGLNGGRALWAWPLAFVGLMIAGGVLGAAEISLPLVEPGILTSVVVLGLLIVLAVRVPLAAGAAIVAVFALLHGHAHGSEVHLELAALPHALGFIAATALLHAFGVGAAYIASGDYGRLVVRGAGALVAALGIYLALTGGAGA
jgi:urease accessory protein